MTRTRIRTCLAGLLLSLLVGACKTPGPATESAVLDAERERIGAMVTADGAWLERVLHEELVFTHSNGLVDTRASLIANLTDGRVDYRSIEPRNREVRILEDTAILSAKVRIVVHVDGRRLVLDSAYTAVYIRDGDRWRLAAYHSSPLET